METWAYCEACERWFYVPTIDLRDDPQPIACPACERLATQLSTVPATSGV